MATINTANVINDSVNATRASIHNFDFGGQNWRDDSISATRGGGVAGYPTGYDWGSAVAVGQGQIFPTGRS